MVHFEAAFEHQDPKDKDGFKITFFIDVDAEFNSFF